MAKAKAANRLIAKFEKFTEHLFTDAIQKGEATQWFRPCVSNATPADFHRAMHMEYAYNSYVGEKRAKHKSASGLNPNRRGSCNDLASLRGSS